MYVKPRAMYEGRSTVMVLDAERIGKSKNNLNNFSNYSMIFMRKQSDRLPNQKFDYRLDSHVPIFFFDFRNM